ncbi:MAG TPA: cytochrome C oxidase subunit IV family protein [Gemmatimonadaceae bacterium]|nr:cytochrome C oxidase subunit IV family protein [Gemmatimonadaceae bacterium]
MAHHDPHHAVPAAHGEHTTHVDHTAMGIEKEHPTWGTYWKVAVFLTAITIVEVWAYYIPAWVNSRAFAPSLIIMSAVKFFTVVMYYMHLKYDHRLFRALFTGSLVIAIVTIIALLFLFGKIAIRTGALVS